MTVKISIIIPVYDVEEYLPKCIDSLLNQTLKDIEIICVNDSSPDNCIEILEDCAAKDDRIKIISQPNQGSGTARNNALEIANGQFISFLDPDDWLDLDFYEKLYNNAKSHDADIAFGNCAYYYPNNEFVYNNYLSKRLFDNTKECYENLVDKLQFIRAFICWGKIYKKEFLDKYNIRFDTIRRYEDVTFSVTSTLLSEKIVPVKETTLYYRQRQNSIMNPVGADKRLFAHFDLFELCKEKILSYDISDEIKKEYSFLIEALEIESLYLHIFDVPKIYKEEYFNKVKERFAHIDIEKNLYLTKKTRKFYNKVNNVRDLSQFERKLFIKKLLQSIFSVEKKDKKKIITLCGLKFTAV